MGEDARWLSVGEVWLAYHRQARKGCGMVDEVAFLPAALSLVETPVHPAPRRFAFAFDFAIMGLFGIQPLEASVVRTGILLQMLSNQKQTKPILRGLEADMVTPTTTSGCGADSTCCELCYCDQSCVGVQ